MTRLEFEIELRSDYHVGSGHRAELIDSALLRDGDGLPALRGSILAGLLRDALWRLLRQAPAGTFLKTRSEKCRWSGLPWNDGKSRSYCRGSDVCPVCRIFGSPACPKKWRVRSARPAGRSEPGQPSADASTVGGRAVQRARVSPRSRRTEPHKLFSEEEGSTLWRFRFDAVCESEDAETQKEAALLTAAARLIRGLGRSRRRGRGECRLHLTDPKREKELLDTFRRSYLTAASPSSSVSSENTPKIQVESTLEAPGPPQRRRLWVRLDEPLLVAVRAEAGNEFESLLDLPGSLLLGAFAGRAARSLGLTCNDAPPPAFLEVFLRGRVLFPTLRFVELSPDGRAVATIPAPRGLLTCKTHSDFKHGDGHGCFAPGSPKPEDGLCPTCQAALRPADGFLSVSPEPRESSPARRQELHIAVDPNTGRVGQGALYGYTCLESGQLFAGDLTCDASAWQWTRSVCRLPEAGEPFTLRLGKASRRGHGRVTAVWEEIGGQKADPWRGLPLDQRLGADLTTVRMTLLTDAVIADPWGRFHEGFSESWIEEEFDRLGLTAKTSAEEEAKVKVRVLEAAARSRLVDGFAGNLGLPRFRDQAVAAGSDALIEFVEPPASGQRDALAALELQGVGLRRGEGFGQVAFNHPIYDEELRKQITDGLPVPGRLVVEFAAHRADAEAVETFTQSWLKTLEEVFTKPDGETQAGSGTFGNPSFDAVARILRQEAGGALGGLVQRLSDAQMKPPGRFGQPRNILGRNLGGPRSEKAVVRETREGRERLLEIIQKLKQATDEASTTGWKRVLAEKPDLTDQLRRIALELLADRVAQDVAAARAQGEERE